MPKKNKLAWRWKKGDITTLADFGDPTTTTDYALCVYDESSATPTLLTITRAPADGTCKKGKPCWKQKGTKGFAYKDKDRTPDGVIKIKLKAGDAGRAKIQLRGKGENLPVPPLPLSLPLRVQLQASVGTCWEATYSTAKKNTPTRFKAKSD